MSSGNSSSFSMLQNQEKKRIPRYEVRFTNTNHETTGAIGTIRTTIWKPAFKSEKAQTRVIKLLAHYASAIAFHSFLPEV